MNKLSKLQMVAEGEEEEETHLEDVVGVDRAKKQLSVTSVIS
jgi:hypothetical protein